jgi:hypothetical protein
MLVIILARYSWSSLFKKANGDCHYIGRAFTTSSASRDSGVRDVTRVGDNNHLARSVPLDFRKTVIFEQGE